MFLILLISFFNVSAPTEIYTYCHTLALHDARPISDYAQPHAGHSGREGPHPFRTGQGPAQPDRLHHRRGETSDAPCPAPMGRGAGTGRSRSRSEEHTSELQSLMRNSYADFCLKKKNKKAINNHTIYSNHHYR